MTVYSASSASGFWSLKELAKAVSSGGFPITYDPYFKSTVLLLNGDGASNGGQNNTFLDSSSNAHTITRNGNVTQGSFSPFAKADGKWGNYFDGTGDWIIIPGNSDFGYGTGDFTIESWVYLNSHKNYQEIFDQRTSTQNSTTASPIIYTDASGNIYFYHSSANRITGTMPLNEWVHVAVSRSGTSTKMFLNGVQAGSTYSDSTNYVTPASNWSIGGSLEQNNYSADGYISNARIVKGTAVYTSEFTPPTEPLTAITGTSLLTCQSNRFIDNSTNAHAITVNGTPKVTTFSPFSQTAPYSADTNGGSGYFDGDGDEIKWSSIPASGDYCIEFWWYPLNTSREYIIDETPSGNKTVVALTAGASTGTFELYVVGTGHIFNVSSVTNMQPFAWHHIAVTRNGTSTKFFVDGLLGGTNTDSTTLFNTATETMIGGYGGTGATYDVTAYISDFRYTTGASIYDSAFTPPTAPLVPVSGTEVLLNFTNASITDRTGSNVLETVGNAQVDTTTFKYGTGALAFDGTGDYLAIPDSDDFAFGSGDFTIEFWARINATGTQVFFDTRPSDNSGTPLVIYTTSSNLIFATPSTTRITGGTLSIDTWYHIALCRSGTSTKMFIDGTQTGSTYTDSNAYTCGANRPLIGIAGYAFGAAPLNGYIDDLRVTKGVARYTADFTPPVAHWDK